MLLIASILCCNLLVVRRLHRAGQSSWGRIRSRTPHAELAAHPHPHSQRSRLRALFGRGRERSASAPCPAGSFQDDSKSPHPPPLIRRFSRSCSRVRALQHSESLDSATHEETAFAKLMGFLCVLFVLCWLPQMVSDC